jgi:hypothetical protein
MTGIELIAKEREEQLIKHGRTVESDRRENGNCQLSAAASTLCWWVSSEFVEMQDILEEEMCPSGWDKEIWKKMLDKPYKERLIIAGALIAAEIDRIS